MTKALVSFADGELHCQLLNVALPRFYDYSIKHGYDLYIPSIEKIKQVCLSYNWDHNRPTSWLKIPIIKSLFLNGYETVLWLDSDIFINKIDIDIAQFNSISLIQGLVAHEDKYEGRVPNAGVWLLNKSALSFLDKMWNLTDYINHKWWEQGAMIELMQNNSEFNNGTIILPYEFNVHKNDTRFINNVSEIIGNFLHATCYTNRLEKMLEWRNNVSK